MNFEQTSDSEIEATENTCLMSESVAMENRAYHADHADGQSVVGRHGDGRQGDRSRLTNTAAPATETVRTFCFYFVTSLVVTCN